VEPKFYLYLDKEGRIWHEGNEIQDPQFAFTILRFLQKTEDGEAFATYQGRTCYFQIEDVPYVVQDIALHKDHRGSLDQVDLIFAGGYTEILDPSRLYVEPTKVLYCQVRKGKFTARFTRKSYFHLAPFIQEDENHQYYVEIGGRRYPVAEQASVV